MTHQRRHQCFELPASALDASPSFDFCSRPPRRRRAINVPAINTPAAPPPSTFKFGFRVPASKFTIRDRARRLRCTLKALFATIAPSTRRRPRIFFAFPRTRLLVRRYVLLSAFFSLHCAGLK
ncbi:hypothetical protein DFH09DRAFT_1341143 [Mycena vulgaris]|nr:hypothetical protein DFH09DRAFT_1341143 [Mycena vulgaris]